LRDLSSLFFFATPFSSSFRHEVLQSLPSVPPTPFGAKAPVSSLLLTAFSRRGRFFFSSRVSPLFFFLWPLDARSVQKSEILVFESLVSLSLPRRNFPLRENWLSRGRLYFFICFFPLLSSIEPEFPFISVSGFFFRMGRVNVQVLFTWCG